MSETNDEAYKKARQENEELKKDMMIQSALAEHTHEMGARIKQLKSLLHCVADTLEGASSETHFQLIQELRKAVE